MCSLHDNLFGEGFITLEYPSYRVSYCRKAFTPATLRQVRLVTLSFRKLGKGAPAKRFLMWHQSKIFGRPLVQG